MNKYIFINICIYICKYRHICITIYVYFVSYMYIHIYIYIYIFVYIYIYIYTCNKHYFGTCIIYIYIIHVPTEYTLYTE